MCAAELLSRSSVADGTRSGRSVEVTRPVLERYQRYLFHYRKKDGKPLSFASQPLAAVALADWFRWMTRQNYLRTTRFGDRVARLPKPLPRV